MGPEQCDASEKDDFGVVTPDASFLAAYQVPYLVSLGTLERLGK